MQHDTAMSVSGSDGLTLKSCVWRNRVSQNEASTPATSPTMVSRMPWPRIIREHVVARGAESHVNADLAPPFAHRVGQDAVGADRRSASARPANMPSN